MFNKRLIATLTLIATIASLVVAFAIPAAAAETYTVTADNYGTTFKPVTKNPFVTDKLELEDGLFSDTDNWAGFTIENKYWSCGSAIQCWSINNNAVWVMPVGMSHTGITFTAPKTGTIDIHVKAWKTAENATVSQLCIGVNTTHWDDSRSTAALTTTPSETTFTLDVTEGDVVAMIGTIGGGNGGDFYFIPTITYHEEAGDNAGDDAGAPDTSDAAVAVALVAFAAAATVVVSKKRH